MIWNIIWMALGLFSFFSAFAFAFPPQPSLFSIHPRTQRATHSSNIFTHSRKLSSYFELNFTIAIREVRLLVYADEDSTLALTIAGSTRI